MFEWPNNARCAVSFSFDDARASQIEFGIPCFDRYELKATFFVLPNGLKQNHSKWIEAEKNGHEIGNHTLSHPCSGKYDFSKNNATEDYSLEQIQQEIDGASDLIESVFGQRPKVFAYPCCETAVGTGDSRQSYIPLIRERFVAARGGGGEPCLPEEVNFGFLNATRMDTATTGELIGAMELARQGGQWIVFLAHDTEPGSPSQGVSLEVLDEVLQWVSQQKDVWCAPIGEVADWTKSHLVG